MDARQAIRLKRDGGRHAEAEIERLVRAYADGEVPDYQMAAWLMAVYFQGLDAAETRALTVAMLHSGRVLRLEDLPGPTVDKHSTGGVGDKISLPLAPLVAACGACVPMISGRGLGHTGGTLDKLESIPGFRTALGVEEFIAQVRSLGFAFGGQTEDLAPADGRLYALRDVTATVECIPLIVSSILSKKFASGTERVVFDVKTGAGAFMRERERAEELARTLITVSRQLDREASALVTAMDEPLGRAVGNALEVEESIEVLRGEGPDEVRELVLALAAEMLVLAARAPDAAAARAEAERALDEGRALERFRRGIEAQGGDPRVVDEPGRLPRAARTHEVPAERSGRVSAIDAYEIGEAVVALGGGRRRKEDGIDPGVGVVLARKVGEAVEAGEPVAVIHARDEAEEARRRVAGAIAIGEGASRPRPRVLERLGADSAPAGADG